MSEQTQLHGVKNQQVGRVGDLDVVSLPHGTAFKRGNCGVDGNLL